MQKFKVLLATFFGLWLMFSVLMLLVLVLCLEGESPGQNWVAGLRLVMPDPWPGLQMSILAAGVGSGVVV